MKFKVGQTVEVVDNYGMVASVGATAIVIKANYDFYGKTLVDVVWKTHFGRQMNGGYQSYHFKLKFVRGEQLLFSFYEISYDN